MSETRLHRAPHHQRRGGWLLVRALLTASVVALSALPALAQGVAADLSGTVRDATGGVIVGAVVNVISNDSGRVRTVESDDLGHYTVPVLSAGDYRIELSADRFGTVTRDVRLAVGEAATVDLELEVADVKESVLVVSASPRSSTGLGDVIDQKQIVDLPLNGRDLQQLTFLQPGVLATTNRNNSASYSHGIKLDINGAGPRSNAFLLDGNTIADFYNNGLGSVAGPVLGVDAVREFRVLTGGYSAVYGGVAGGIVTVVTRAGANQLQGSLFEFFRNDAMDARGFFDVEKPDFTRHQFGASLGGPIVANHTFFFAAVEGLHERLGLTRVTTVPSAQARAGLLPDPARPGSTIGVNPLMRPYIDLFPVPNGRDFGDGLAEYAFGALQKSDEAFGQLRIDHQVTANISAFGRYTFDDASKDEPTAFPGLPIDWDSRYHFATAQVDQIVGQHLVNTVRLGFSRTFIGQTDAGSRTTSLSVIPGRPLPQLQIGGMPNYGTLTASTTTASQDVWSLADEVSLSRGRHLFKIGGLLERFHADQDYQFYWGGRYTFPSVQRFVQGLPSVVLISLPGSDSVRELASTQFASYVHDDFRLASNLTLNLGLRWEFSTEPTEGRGLLVALPDPLRDTAVTQGELFRNHKANIAPRLGFAWSPGGRTIVSSAVGRYFDINSLPYIAQLLNNPPAFHQVTIANPAFPNTQFGSILPSLSVPSYDWRTPEMWHYNASVEHDLGKNMVVGAAYAGSRGIHLVRDGDANMPNPVIQADGTPFFPAGAPRRNPNFGAIQLRATDSRSWYNALILTARRRMSAGLQFQAGYTLSKTTDEVQGSLPTEALGSITRMYYFDLPSFDRGPADFDRRHNLLVNAVWDLPFFRSGRGLAAALLGRWTVSGILTAQSGNPFTPGIQSDYSRTLARVALGRPNFNPNFSGEIVRGGPEQYFDPAAYVLQPQGTLGTVPRNSLVGPGLVTLDLGGFRNLQTPWLGQRSRLQLRIEVFNALNRTNFGLPQRIVFAGASPTEPSLANAGRITSTTTSARQIQLAAKLLW